MQRHPSAFPVLGGFARAASGADAVQSKSACFSLRSLPSTVQSSVRLTSIARGRPKRGLARFAQPRKSKHVRYRLPVDAGVFVAADGDRSPLDGPLEDLLTSYWCRLPRPTALVLDRWGPTAIVNSGAYDRGRSL